MVDYNDIKELALTCGFSHVGNLDVSTIKMREEVRAACAENKCKQYGKSWSCPPGCGTLEECEERIKKYSRGLILQSTGELEDAFDAETMIELAETHGNRFDDFSSKLRAIYPDAMVIGAGACRKCEKCTYPDKPCRFPDKMTSSMEALGMIVSDVCQANGIPYYYGPGTLTYVGCVLID
jgi:predicted metal-binding protein